MVSTKRFLLASLLALTLLCVNVLCDDEVTPIPFSELGIPIRRIEEHSLEAGGSEYFKLKYKDDEGNVLPIDNTQTLFFMVTPIAGDVDLYLRARAKPQLDDKGECPDCIGQSTSAHGDFVRISKNSIYWPSGDDWSFYILVKGAPDTISSYSLTVWISDHGEDHKGSVIELQDGFPQIAIVPPMQYTYFKFKISDDAEIANQGHNADDFQVILTPFTGDPDIFISTDAEGGTKRPSSSEYWWKSMGLEQEKIEIKKGTDHFTKDGWYYMGIHAFGFMEDAYFMLSVTSRKRYVQVIEAMDFEDKLQTTGSHNYYKYYMPVNKAQEILLSLTPNSPNSDPDLFVYPQSEYDANHPPSSTNCKWCRQSTGDDSVTIPKSDAVRGYFYIGVKAFKHDTSYNLLAVTERSNIFLKDGIPVTTPLQSGKYRYFKFYNYDTMISGLTFSAVASAGTDIDMYLAGPDARNTHPTSQKKDHVGDSAGNSVSYTYVGGQKEGPYYFSLLSPKAGNVTVSAITNTTATVLQNHIPLPFINIPQNNYRYFVFEPTINDKGKFDGEVIVNLGISQGEADLFVSTQIPRPTEAKCKEFKNCWVASSWKADSIVIKPDDPLIENGQRVYIGATGVNSFNLVTLMASMSGEVYELSDGTSVSGAVLEQEYAFYAIHVPTRARVSIQLTLSDENTEANMFASKEYKPTKVGCEGDYQCYTSQSIGDDVIDETLSEGTWYISVYGISPQEAGKAISFSIKASQKYHFLNPSDTRHPFIFESVPQNTLQQIKVTPIWANANWLSITTTLITGRTKMYISPGDEPATKDNHKYVADGWPGNVFMVHKDSTNEDDFKQSKWTVGVESLEDSDYWVFADTGMPYTHASALTTNVPRLSVVSNSSRYYKISIPYNNTGTWFDPDYQPIDQDYYLNLRMFRGSVRIMIGQDRFRYPHTKNESIYYYEGPSDTLLVLGKDKIVASGHIRITVEKMTVDDAMFELTLSTGDLTRYLVQDQPQKLLLDSTSKSSFMVWNSRRHPKDLQLVVESCTNVYAPEFYLSKENKSPDSGHHDLRSYPVGYYQQVINSNINATQLYVGLPKSTSDNQLTSIYATTHAETSKPVLEAGYIRVSAKGSTDGLNNYLLTIPRAKPPSRFKQWPLKYEIYSKRVAKGSESPAKVNMKTVCGIQYGLFKVGTYQSDLGESGPVSYILESINPEDVYQVNVVVHNGMGMQTAYEGFWIVHGDIYPEYPNFIQALMVSPGTIIMTVGAFVLIMYFLIGSIINVIRGKQGLDVIPNRKFWFALPYLVADGVAFILTCGRRSTSSKLDDDDEVDDDIDQVNLGTSNPPEEKEEAPSSGGYGAID